MFTPRYLFLSHLSHYLYPVLCTSTLRCRTLYLLPAAVFGFYSPCRRSLPLALALLKILQTTVIGVKVGSFCWHIIYRLTFFSTFLFLLYSFIAFVYLNTICTICIHFIRLDVENHYLHNHVCFMSSLTNPDRVHYATSILHLRTLWNQKWRV